MNDEPVLIVEDVQTKAPIVFVGYQPHVPGEAPLADFQRTRCNESTPFLSLAAAIDPIHLDWVY